jgi:hypothetical protein
VEGEWDIEGEGGEETETENGRAICLEGGRRLDSDINSFGDGLSILIYECRLN